MSDIITAEKFFAGFEKPEENVLSPPVGSVAVVSGCVPPGMAEKLRAIYMDELKKRGMR